MKISPPPGATKPVISSVRDIAATPPAPETMAPAPKKNDAFDANANTNTQTIAPTQHRGASAALQMIGLRSQTTTAPKTEGAKASLFGISVQAIQKFVAKAALVVAMALPILCTPNTIYVNVNGAQTTSPEYRGAKQAAVEHREAFLAMKPGGLAQAFADAEAGAPFRKLVISGHSGGEWFSGHDAEGHNNLSFDEVKALVTQYPAAAKKIGSFFAMACNVGTEENSRRWMELLSSTNALVGFDHIAPSHQKQASKDVLVLVDRELSKIDWSTLTREKAEKLAVRLSKLPGVSLTEFSIRLRANDGTTVFFSKLNKATDLSVITDLAAQLRSSAFEPYLRGDVGFENPPASHGASSPLRRFYNASQDLLSAQGRALTAQGISPDNDAGYQQTRADKEQVLRLMYFSTVAGNVEMHLRPELNDAARAMSEAGIDLRIPALHRMTRAEIISVANEYQANVHKQQVAAWQTGGAADRGVVTGYLQTHQLPAESIWASNDPESIKTAKSALMAIGADTQVPAHVRAAADRLVHALGNVEAVQAVQRILVDGLRDLKPDIFAPAWVTTEANI